MTDPTAPATRIDDRSTDTRDAGAADTNEEGVRVRTHPSLCMGMGNCHRWAPEVYPLDDEGMIAIHMLAVPPELAYKAWLGATVCPERAITVIGPPEEYWVRRRADSGTAADPPEQ